MSVAIEARGCCSTAQSAWTTNPEATAKHGGQGRTPVNPRQADSLGSQRRRICVIKPKPESQYLAWTWSAACVQPGPRPSRCLIALPSFSTSSLLPAWSRSRIVFPPLRANPVPETLLSVSGQGRSRDLGRGFKGLGKNLPLGISFLHLPGINCPLEMEALQLGGELLRAKCVEAKMLPVPPCCRNWVLKGPGKGEESSLSRGPMQGRSGKVFCLSSAHANVAHSTPGIFPGRPGRQEQACKAASTMGNTINGEKQGFLFGLYDFLRSLCPYEANVPCQ